MQKTPAPEEEDESQYEDIEAEDSFADIHELLKVPNPLLPAWTIKKEDLKAQREIEKIPHDDPEGVRFRSDKEKETPTVGKTFAVDATEQRDGLDRPFALFGRALPVNPMLRRSMFNPFHRR